MLPAHDPFVRQHATNRMVQGEPPADVARALGIPLATLYRWRRLATDQATTRQQRFAAARVEVLRRVALGEPARAIAAAVGVGVSSVYRWSGQGES